jgi:dolichol-phosphate mannosyltransferase
VIIPTYNERDNLEELIRRTSAACSATRMSYEIVIVDDNSPDGTGALAEEMGKSFNVKVVHRAGKLGLSTAVTDGFKAASGSVFVVMDADLSHPPEKISEMVERITKGGADMVVGSRYVEGGHVENWPFHRRLMSKGATLLARGLNKVKDPMSGYFALKREVVEGVELNPVGYKIGLEILVKGKVRKVEEVPITFADRKAGKSKLGASVTLKYIDHCLLLYEHKKPWLARYIKFALVGGVGTLINLAIFWTSIDYFYLSEWLAIVLAFVVADTNNFIWNRWWTFRSKEKVHFQYPQFLVVSFDGLMLNLILYSAFTDHMFPALGLVADDGSLYKVFAQVMCIFLVSIFNFFANALWTFEADMRPRSRT